MSLRHGESAEQAVQPDVYRGPLWGNINGHSGGTRGLTWTLGNLMSFEDALFNRILRLRQNGIAFDIGLSDLEVSRIESHFHFVFPPDLRFFLQTAMPLSPYFVNWRAEFDELEMWFASPFDGVLFDVQNNTFWHPEWGIRPITPLDALEVANACLEKVPKLVPIGDRVFTKCVPTVPSTAGNPVFSVRQTDVLHAGRDLVDFLDWFTRPTELFERDESEGLCPTPMYGADYRIIPFWTDLVRKNACQ